MLTALRYFLARHPVALGVFAAALVAVVIFAVKFWVHFGHFHGDTAQNQPLEEWMRPRYVAMSYRLPPKVLREILQIGPPPDDRSREPLTMADIAAERGISLDELSATVRAGAAAFHQERAR